MKRFKEEAKEQEIKISKKFMEKCKCLTKKEKDLFIEFIRYLERKEIAGEKLI